MTEPLAERGAPQSVTGYTFDCLAPVLAHPDLAPTTAPLHETPRVLDSIAELGRASVSEGHLEEFAQWQSYAFNYASQVAARNPFAGGELRAPLAKLLFYGSTAGDVAASDKLHSMLTHSPIGPLEAVIASCASVGVPPQVWISKYGVSAMHRTELALTYHRAQKQAVPTQRSGTPHGIPPHIEASDATLDELGEGYLLDRGHALMEVATHSQKQGLFARLQHALETNDEPISMQTHFNFEKFALSALVDPSLSDEAKNWLMDELVTQLSEVHSLSDKTLEGQFDTYAATPSKLILNVADLHQQTAIQNGQAHLARDEVLAYASRAAIGNGQAQIASAIIPEIHDNADWSASVMQYFDAFGPTKDLKPNELIGKLEPHREAQYSALFSLASHDPAGAKTSLRKLLKQTDRPEMVASFLMDATQRLSEQNTTMAIEIAARTLSLTKNSGDLPLQTAMQNILTTCGAEHAEGLFAHYLRRVQRYLGKYAVLSSIAGHRVAATKAPTAQTSSN